MEQKAKRRKLEDTAKGLLDLPRDERFLLVLQMPTLIDVFALCQVSRDFERWCNRENIVRQWERQKIGLNDMRREVTKQAIYGILHGDVAFFTFNDEQYMSVFADSYGDKVLRVSIDGKNNALNVKVEDMLMSFGEITINVEDGEISLNFKSYTELEKLIYKILDMGFSFPFESEGKIRWIRAPIEISCISCENPALEQCSECGVPYCGSKCFSIDVDHHSCESIGRKARLRTKKQRAKFSKVMREFKKGKLRSGSGKKVTSRKQAIAIAFSEARKMK